MAIPEGVSCEICLRADEPEEMFRVAIPYAAHNPDRVATICRPCACAINDASAAALEEASGQGPEHED